MKLINIHPKYLNDELKQKICSNKEFKKKYTRKYQSYFNNLLPNNLITSGNYDGGATVSLDDLENIRDIALSPDGTKVAISSEDMLYFYDTQTNKKIFEQKINNFGAYELCWANNSTMGLFIKANRNSCTICNFILNDVTITIQDLRNIDIPTAITHSRLIMSPDNTFSIITTDKHTLKINHSSENLDITSEAEIIPPTAFPKLGAIISYDNQFIILTQPHLSDATKYLFRVLYAGNLKNVRGAIATKMDHKCVGFCIAPDNSWFAYATKSHITIVKCDDTLPEGKLFQTKSTHEIKLGEIEITSMKMVPNGLILLVFTEAEVLGVTLKYSFGKELNSEADIIYTKNLFNFTPFDIRMLENETILVGKKDNKYDYMFINNNPFYINKLYKLIKTIPNNDSQIILYNKNRIQLLDANTFMLLKSLSVPKIIEDYLYVNENSIYFIDTANDIYIIDLKGFSEIKRIYHFLDPIENANFIYISDVFNVENKTYLIIPIWSKNDLKLLNYAIIQCDTSSPGIGSPGIGSNICKDLSQPKDLNSKGKVIFYKYDKKLFYCYEEKKNIKVFDLLNTFIETFNIESSKKITINDGILFYYNGEKKIYQYNLHTKEKNEISLPYYISDEIKDCGYINNKQYFYYKYKKYYIILKLLNNDYIIFNNELGTVISIGNDYLYYKKIEEESRIEDNSKGEYEQYYRININTCFKHKTQFKDAWTNISNPESYKFNKFYQESKILQEHIIDPNFMTKDSQGRTYSEATLSKRYKIILKQANDIHIMNTELIANEFKNAYMYTAHGSIDNTFAFIVPQNVTLIFLASSNTNYIFQRITYNRMWVNEFDVIINLNFCKNMFSPYKYSINNKEQNDNNCHIYPPGSICLETGLQHIISQADDMSYGMYSLQEYYQTIKKKDAIENVVQRYTNDSLCTVFHCSVEQHASIVFFKLCNKLGVLRNGNEGEIIEFKIRDKDNSLLKSIEEQNKIGSEIGTSTVTYLDENDSICSDCDTNKGHKLVNDGEMLYLFMTNCRSYRSKEQKSIENLSKLYQLNKDVERLYESTISTGGSLRSQRRLSFSGQVTKENNFFSWKEKYLELKKGTIGSEDPVSNFDLETSIPVTQMIEVLETINAAFTS